MRNLLGILLIAITSSCFKQDPIIGSWRIDKDLINEATTGFEECSRKTINTFTKDSIFIFENFVLDEVGNCQSLGKITGFWDKINDSTYLMSKGKYVDTIHLHFFEKKSKMILKNKFREDIFQMKKIK